MQVTVFTGNQPRHISLIGRLAGIADTVFAVQECTTVFPGRVADFFRKSDVMQAYFGHVIAAEQRIFGGVGFLPANVRSMSLKADDLNDVPRSSLAPALSSDVYVVFGASYIKGWLVDHLVARRAINIHMGMSPWYRGSSCNFWALYDGHPDLVGATIHLLSRGLDSGGILFHVQPAPGDVAPFDLGMRAVEAAHRSLADSISTREILGLAPSTQDKSLQIRYTRNADFTDAVAAEFLERLPHAADIGNRLRRRPDRPLLAPRYL